MRTATRPIAQADVVLASASPRRTALLSMVGIPHRVIPSEVEEDLEPDLAAGSTVAQAVERLAIAKAAEVAAREPRADLVIGADTVVLLGDRVLTKPRDPDDARAMLQQLSGRTHRVLTGYAVLAGRGGERSPLGGHFPPGSGVSPGKPEESEHAAGMRHGRDRISGTVTTAVHMRPLEETEIASYVGSGEPLDKAGSYAIQGKGSLFVTAIEGSYPNVVGLPLEAIEQALRQLGWQVV